MSCSRVDYPISNNFVLNVFKIIATIANMVRSPIITIKSGSSIIGE